MGPAALLAARKQSSDSPPAELSRAELQEAVCGTLPAREPMPRSALACGRGDECEATRLSDGVVVGRVVRRENTSSHILCPLCCIVAIQTLLDADKPVAVLPFSVRAGTGPDQVHPRDCHKITADGRARIEGNMVTLAALGMRWTGAALVADGLAARDKLANGPLSFYGQVRSGPSWLHSPTAVGELRQVSSLFLPGGLRSVSREAGIAHLGGGDAAAWEAEVAAAWAAFPARRLWLGALLDAAAVGGSDWRGPWPGDLIDVLAVHDEVSLRAIYNDMYSAPATWTAVVVIVYKTLARAAHRRECAPMLARLSETCPGMWFILRDALIHVLLGTWPVPNGYYTLAHRRAVLAFVGRGDDRRRAWLENHTPLVLLAAFYMRYVAERSRGAQWAAQSPVARAFWTRFEGVLEHARAVLADLAQLGDAPFAAARGAEGPAAARVLAFETAVTRWAASPRGNMAAVPPAGTAMCLAAGAPANDAHALMCMRCVRIVHLLVGGRGPCRLVKRHRDIDGACCCASGVYCTQRRAHGCCCSTKSTAQYDHDTSTLRCTRRRGGTWCDAVLVPVPMDRAVLCIPRHGLSEYIVCTDCAKLCFYRRDHHYSDGYHCGCAVYFDEDPCFVCGTGAPGGRWVLVGVHDVPQRLCPDHVKFHKKTWALRRHGDCDQVRNMLWKRNLLSLSSAIGRKRRQRVN